MPNRTKYALEDSLKKLLLAKPLDKIKINDITEDCGISRMAFYYHFKDIYDLVEWICVEDATKILQGNKTYATWQEGYLMIFEAVQKDKPFIMNVYNSMSREQVENYLYALTYDLLLGVVEEQAEGMRITDGEKKLIANYHKYAFVGLVLDWIKDSMKQNPRDIVENASTMLHGAIKLSIENFAQEGSTV